MPSRIETLTNAASSSDFMVATAFPAATEAAVAVLKRGGNAIDAAVTAAWALSVCEPSGSGLGGQTTMLIYLPDGKVVALDGHSYAPAAVSLRTVNAKQQKRGFRSCTIPSTPAILGLASSKYGKLPIDTLIEPAVKLAYDGFQATKLFRQHIRWCKSALQKSNFATKSFLSGGKPPPRGKDFRQKNLAKTLERIAAYSPDDFYRGKLAKAIVKDMQRNGGLLNSEDLAHFELPIEHEPLEISYRGYRIVSMPPPSGGIQLLTGLKVLESLNLEPSNNGNVEWYETMALTINAIFRERHRWPLNPEFVTPSVKKWLLSDERAEEIATTLKSSVNLTPLMVEEEPGETTHLCVVDKDGMAVSLTQSIQSLYGAKVANKELGFFYNNYLCTCPRYHHPYQLKSHAMPQSNLAPTFIFRNPTGALKKHDLRLIVGAAGSRRITGSILQTITNMIDREMTLQEAVNAPRIHAMMSGKAVLESRIASKKLTDRLSRYFRYIQIKAEYSHAMGSVQAIERNEDGKYIGIADPRREGAALGE